jgi:hypothetical protein
MTKGNLDERPDDGNDAEAERELAELRARADLSDPWSSDAARRKPKAKRPRPRGYRRPQSRTPAGLQRECRDRRAVEMRSLGFTYERIAAELGLANKGGAHKAVERGLKRCETASAPSYFRLELLRVEALERECKRRIFAGEGPIARLVQTAINLWEHRMALTGLLATGEIPYPDPVWMPAPLDGALDELDGLAEDAHWPEHARQLTIHRVFKTFEAGHRPGKTDQTDVEVQEIVNDAEIAGAVEWAEDAADLEDIGWRFGLTKAEVAAAADRHARRATEEVVEVFRSREQDRLRRIELDAFAKAICSDTSRGWDRQVATFVRASRGRCKLLGLFHDPRRGPLAGSNLPTSPDVEAEIAETILFLVEWRRGLLLSPSEAV